MIRAKQRSGVDAIMKLGAYLDMNNLRGWDLVKGIRSYSELYVKLKEVLVESEVKWIKEKLGNLEDVEVDGIEWDNIVNDWRTRHSKGEAIKKLLTKLKIQIQEELMISLVDAFQMMNEKAKSCQEFLTREEFKSVVNCFGIPFTPSEIGLLVAGFDFFPNTGLFIESWVRELCSVSGPTTKYSSRISSAKKNLPIILKGPDLTHRLSELSIKLRPSTANASKLIQNQISFPDNETTVSEITQISAGSITNISNAVPGRRLIEASSHLLLNSNPNHKLGEKKSMRCLGSLIYSGPGQNHEILGEIGRDGTVEVLAQAGVWCQVKVKNVEGWVPKHKLESIVDRHIYAPHDLTHKLTSSQTVEIRSTFLLRKEPNWRSRGVVNVNPGQMLKTEGLNGEWVKVSTEEGGVGWVPTSITNLNLFDNTPKSFKLPSHRSVKLSRSPVETSFSTRNSAVTFRGVAEFVNKSISDLQQSHKEDLDHRFYVRELQKRIISKWKMLSLCVSFNTWKDLAYRPTYHELAQKEIRQEIQGTRKALEISIKSHREKLIERAYEEASKIRYSSEHIRRSLQKRSETERNAKFYASYRLRTSIASRMLEAKEELTRRNREKAREVKEFPLNTSRDVTRVLV
jgi:SH3-like domain-containing protein